MLLRDILHNETKKRALAIHKEAVEKLNGVIAMGQMEWECLSKASQRTMERIESIEDFINSIPNLPEELDFNVEISYQEHREFRQTEDYDIVKTGKEAVKLGGRITLGVAGGGIFAKTAPPFAKWVAKTFGKASTGVPISSLRGAAQESAIKALLGGGPLAKGGGGIAAGQARLALAVPIGVGIAGLAIAGSVVAYVRDENKNTAEQAKEEANKLKMVADQLENFSADILRIRLETEELLGRVSEQFQSLQLLKDGNYIDMSDDEQLQMESLVENTLALAERLNRIAEWMTEAEDWLLRKGVGETPPTF